MNSSTELGNIITLQRGYDLPNRDRISGPYPIISSSGISGTHNEYKVSGENVITGRYGTIGEVYYYSGKCWPLNTSLFVKDFHGNNTRYSYYLLKHALKMLKIDGKDKSTVPGVDRNVLHQLKVPFIPSVSYQKEIVHILELLDKKIENNMQINDNLEAQLKLIFDYWFTQYNFPDYEGKPYKSNGGQMVFSTDLGREIPVGWKVSTLGELVTKNNSPFDYSTSQPAIDLSVMPSDSISLNQLNSSDNFTTNLYQMKKGDLLFGSIRPYLQKAGIAPRDGVFAGTIHSYNVVKEKYYNFVLATMTRKTFFDFALNVSTGSKMPVVNNTNLLSYKVCYSPEIIDRFSNLSIKETILSNVNENQELMTLREWLLPMLMNGQAIVES